MRTIRHFAAACALGAATWVAGAAPPAAAEELVVGVFLPTTGPLAPLGNDMKRGFELAAKGAKVKGQPVRIIIEDTAANPANGVRKAQKLVLEDKAKILIGGASSAVTLAVNAQSARLNVPIITTNAQAVAVTGDQCSRFLFRTVPNDAMSAKAIGIMMQKRPDLLAKNWFIVYHDFAYGHSNKAEFSKIPGIKIAGDAGRPVGTADWSSAISQIQASKADAIYLALAVGDDLTAFVNQARAFGINYVMMAPVGIPDSMLQALGKNGVGMVAGGLTTSWMQEATNPKIRAFVKAYHAANGVVPGYQAIQAYAGFQFMLAALEASSDHAPDTIVKALETTKADTIVGPIQIRKGDHQAMVGAYMAEAVALPEEMFGAKVGWKLLDPITWDQMKVELADTGCKGL
ncbi:ABC transporter substrate-binding protein [Xanthobacter pseudotagetidis]|uniref:ABC transporter substrate-binding protein n=1 Tax=Xanthobacter pseudotagetidis TaxID=3119911 RepID=UPI00372812A0